VADGSDLLLGLADEVALADKDLVRIEARHLALRVVRPPHDQHPLAGCPRRCLLFSVDLADSEPTAALDEFQQWPSSLC
jgi:hypothetical protein